MSSDRAVQPLSPAEEETWRALIRLMVRLPRAIDDDLVHRAGLSLTRYVVLMRLSEAPQHALRMTDLAQAASISPSRITRIIQSMVSEGLITREVVAGDGRASLATVTDEGLQRLRGAWPAHLAGVRELVLDHVPAGELAAFNRVMRGLLDALDSTDDLPTGG